jgi:hypothetical protein
LAIVSIATIFKIQKKKQFLQWLKLYMSKRPIILSGFNVIVEVDETVLSRKGINRETTSTDDSTPSTGWIVGDVDHTK